MTPHETIFLQCTDAPLSDDSTWCSDKIHDSDIEYILADRYAALSKDNARLHAELATVKDELIDALNELVNVKAALAAIKPSWGNAPKWAEWHIIETCYYGKYMKSADTVTIKEYRPEDS